MSDTERIMRVEIVLGPIADPGQLDATRDAAISYRIEYELRPKREAAERIDAIPTPRTKLLARGEQRKPSGDERRWARLGAGERQQNQKARVDQRIVKKWAHDKNVVFEPTRNANGSLYMRLNVIETLRNMGITMSELSNGKWPNGSLEKALKFAMSTQGRHRNRRRLENRQEQQAATQESE